MAAAWIVDRCFLTGLATVLDQIAEHLDLEELCWLFATTQVASWTWLSSRVMRKAVADFGKKISGHQQEYWDEMFSDFEEVDPPAGRQDLTSFIRLPYPTSDSVLDAAEIVYSNPLDALELVQDALDLSSRDVGKYKEREYIDCLELGHYLPTASRFRTEFNPKYPVYAIAEDSPTGNSLCFTVANLPGKDRSFRGQIVYKSSALEPGLKGKSGLCVTSWSTEGTHLAVFFRRSSATLLIKFYRYYSSKNTLRQIAGVGLEVDLLYLGAAGRLSWLDDCTFIYPGYKANSEILNQQLRYLRFSKNRKEVLDRAVGRERFSCFKGYLGAAGDGKTFFTVQGCDVKDHFHDIIQFHLLREEEDEPTVETVRQLFVPGYIACCDVRHVHQTETKAYFAVRGPRHKLMRFSEIASRGQGQHSDKKCPMICSFLTGEPFNHHCDSYRKLRVLRILEVDLVDWTHRFLPARIPGCGWTLSETCDKYELRRIEGSGMRTSLEVSENFVSLQTDDRRTIHVSRKFNFWLPSIKYQYQTIHPQNPSLYVVYKRFSKHGKMLARFYTRRSLKIQPKKRCNVHRYGNHVSYRKKNI